MAGKLTEEQKAEIVRRYDTGVDIPTLARSYGVTGGAIRYHLLAADRKVRSRLEAAADRRDEMAESITIERLRELYWGSANGYPSVLALSRRFGLTEMKLRRRMERAGIRLRSMSEQIAIEHRFGRINWGGKRYSAGNTANFGDKTRGRKGYQWSRTSIERMRATKAALYPRPQGLCRWCGLSFSKRYQRQECCCKSHGAHWRWFRRAGTDRARPAIVDRLRDLLQSEPFKALPLYNAMEKAGSTIGATDAEYAEIMAEWAQG